MLIAFLGSWILATVPARADDSGAEGIMYFKGPMATCLSSAKIVYPCISLSPPSYQINSAFTSNLEAVTELPLDSDQHDSNWLLKLKTSELWNPKWRISHDAQGMDMNFSLENAGVVMNMNLGSMKFNVLVDEGRFSESQFFLGVDRSW